MVLLAAHLTEANVDELLRAAAGKRNFEIEILIAERFPRPDLPQKIRSIQPVSPAVAGPEHAPSEDLLSVRTVEPAPTRVSTPPQPQTPRPKITPLAPQRFGLQTTISQAALNDLHRAQLLLSHQIPSGDVAQFLERALRALVVQLEKTKLAATSKPSKLRTQQPMNPRIIPAHVKRNVWRRDGGQCTFTSDTGHRCSARSLLELDHVQEVARGGRATFDNLRLRCRAHNQYGAERTFGAEFMERKRQERQRAS